MPKINKFRKLFSESFTNAASKLFELFWYMSWIKLLFSRNALQWIHTVLFLQRIVELSPPSYILYTLKSSCLFYILYKDKFWGLLWGVDTPKFDWFPFIFHQTLLSDSPFSALAWSVECFTSLFELFNHLPNSFKANMQLFLDARITLTFFYGGLRLHFYLQLLVKSFFINFYFCNVK